jgi:hypothetical protein
MTFFDSNGRVIFEQDRAPDLAAPDTLNRPVTRPQSRNRFELVSNPRS